MEKNGSMFSYCNGESVEEAKGSLKNHVYNVDLKSANTFRQEGGLLYVSHLTTEDPLIFSAFTNCRLIATGTRRQLDQTVSWFIF